MSTGSINGGLGGIPHDSQVDKPSSPELGGVNKPNAEVAADLQRGAPSTNASLKQAPHEHTPASPVDGNASAAGGLEVGDTVLDSAAQFGQIRDQDDLDDALLDDFKSVRTSDTAPIDTGSGSSPTLAHHKVVQDLNHHHIIFNNGADGNPHPVFDEDSSERIGRDQLGTHEQLVYDKLLTFVANNGVESFEDVEIQDGAKKTIIPTSSDATEVLKIYTPSIAGTSSPTKKSFHLTNTDQI